MRQKLIFIQLHHQKITISKMIVRVRLEAGRDHQLVQGLIKVTVSERSGEFIPVSWHRLSVTLEGRLIDLMYT